MFRNLLLFTVTRIIQDPCHSLAARYPSASTGFPEPEWEPVPELISREGILATTNGWQIRLSRRRLVHRLLFVRGVRRQASSSK
jgi:hypothetical protein